jgi:hypothetical protein
MDPWFDVQKCEKFTAGKKKSIFFDQKLQIYLSIGLHKGLQATEEAFGPHKRTNSISKHEISHFSYFCG